MAIDKIDASAIWDHRFTCNTEVVSTLKEINFKFSSYSTFGELENDIELKTNIAKVIGYIRHITAKEAWRYFIPWYFGSLIPWASVSNFSTHPVKSTSDSSSLPDPNESIEYHKDPIDHHEVKEFINRLSTNAPDIFSNSDQARFYFRNQFNMNIKGVSGSAYEDMYPTTIRGLLDRLHSDSQLFMTPTSKYSWFTPLITGILFLLVGLLTIASTYFKVGSITGMVCMILGMLVCQISVASRVRYSYEVAIHARRVATNKTLGHVSQALATFAMFIGAFVITRETPVVGKILNVTLLIIVTFSTVSTIHMNNIAEMILTRQAYGSSGE